MTEVMANNDLRGSAAAAAAAVATVSRTGNHGRAATEVTVAKAFGNPYTTTTTTVDLLLTRRGSIRRAAEDRPRGGGDVKIRI